MGLGHTPDKAGVDGLGEAGVGALCGHLIADHRVPFRRSRRLRIPKGAKPSVCAMRDSPRVPSVADSQCLPDAFNELARHWALSGLPTKTKPKMHLLCRMTDNAECHGNPTTFADEGLLRVFAQMGRAAHQNVWEMRMLAPFQTLQMLMPKRKSQRCG